MRFWLFVYLTIYSALSAAMLAGHQEGKAAANSLLSGTQVAATRTNPATVPGFVTDSPKEASLDNGSIGGATSAEVRSNEAAVALSENSRTRQKFVFDPNTDPMFINANRAVANPEQTLQEMIVETADGTGEQDEIIECVEGGDEYMQTCTKQQVVRLQFIPEIKEQQRYCSGHASGKISKKNRNNPNQLSWCGGCRTRTVIKQKRQVETLQDEWVDGCAFLEAQSEAGVCRHVSVTTVGKQTRDIAGPVVNPLSGTPTIDSEPMTKDVWEETNTYACLKPVESTCSHLRAKGCVQISSICIEEIEGVCVAWKQTFRCVSAKKKTRKYRAVGEKSLFCLTGDCAESDYEANGEMLNAMTQLVVLKEAQQDISTDNGPNVRIFKGQVRQCRKNCVGFRDCCTTGKGWGLTLNLVDCSGEERELADWREKKRCVFVGTYCAERDSVFKTCIRKKSSYCCFGTKLAKLINAQGRAQLGISWGDRKAPDCRGLSTEELSRLDMSRMDLSELYEDVQQNFKPKTQEHIAQGVELDRIRENMTRMTKKVKTSAESTAASAIPQNVGCKIPNCAICAKKCEETKKKQEETDATYL